MYPTAEPRDVPAITFTENPPDAREARELFFWQKIHARRNWMLAVVGVAALGFLVIETIRLALILAQLAFHGIAPTPQSLAVLAICVGVVATRAYRWLVTLADGNRAREPTRRPGYLYLRRFGD